MPKSVSLFGTESYYGTAQYAIPTLFDIGKAYKGTAYVVDALLKDHDRIRSIARCQRSKIASCFVESFVGSNTS